MVILSPRGTFSSGSAFLNSELLTFHALDLLDMCQVVSLLPFHLCPPCKQQGKYFFFHERSLLGSSETNF